MAAAAPAEQMASGSESGVVVRWMSGKGYGFIKPEGTEEQLFVHFRNFMQQRKTLNIGENVTFDRGVDERSGKARAVNVTGDFSGTEPEPFRGGRGGGRGGRGGFRGGRGRGRGFRGRGRGRGGYGGRGGGYGGRGNSRNYSPYGDSNDSYGQGQAQAYGGYGAQAQYGAQTGGYGGQSAPAASMYGQQQQGGNPYGSGSSQYSQY